MHFSSMIIEIFHNPAGYIFNSVTMESKGLIWTGIKLKTATIVSRGLFSIFNRDEEKNNFQRIIKIIERYF